jgi:hypothetical protein
MLDLKVLAIPVPPGHEHPDPPDPRLPKHEFSMMLVAPKGAGKTTLIGNFIYWMKGYFHDIFVFSPTVRSDEKWNWIKQQKILAENIPLKKWIKKEQARRDGAFANQIVQDPPIGHEFDGANTNEKDDFDGKIPESNFYYDYTEDDFNQILVRQQNVINALEKHGQPKYLADRILFIFDDLVGSCLFSQAQDNLFKGYSTRHRHYSSSAIYVTQGYKEVPKTIRSNNSCMILFEISNDKELEVIYEENTMTIKKDPWLEMYHHAVAEPFAFLYLNVQKPKGERCMKNFDTVLTIQPDDEMTPEEEAELQGERRVNKSGWEKKKKINKTLMRAGWEKEKK